MVTQLNVVRGVIPDNTKRGSRGTGLRAFFPLLLVTPAPMSHSNTPQPEETPKDFKVCLPYRTMCAR
jgi:hypothetical protein